MVSTPFINALCFSLLANASQFNVDFDFCRLIDDYHMFWITVELICSKSDHLQRGICSGNEGDLIITKSHRINTDFYAWWVPKHVSFVVVLGLQLKGNKFSDCTLNFKGLPILFCSTLG